MKNRPLSILLAVVALIASGLAGYAVASALQLGAPAAPAPHPSASAEAPSDSSDEPPATARNPFAASHGTNLIAFVITASDCGWATQPTIVEAVGRIRGELGSRYGDSFAQVKVVGVALDQDVEVGLDFLRRLGKGETKNSFDQVIVGGSWLNEQIVKFVWRDGVAETASPQVLVVERTIDTSHYLSSSTIGVGSDRIVANPSGNRRILEWIDEGMPLAPSASPG